MSSSPASERASGGAAELGPAAPFARGSWLASSPVRSRLIGLPGALLSPPSPRVWTCMFWLDDGGLCREACFLSYHTTWFQIPDDHASWAARYPARSLWNPPRRSWNARSTIVPPSREALLLCMSAVGLYYEPGEKWKQHDELLYKFGSVIRC